MDTNIRFSQKFEASLEFSSGVFVGYVAPGVVITRLASGSYKLKLRDRYPRLLTSYVGNGGAAAKLSDAALLSAGELTLTISEPAETDSTKVSVTFTVQTSNYNENTTVAGLAAPTVTSLTPTSGSTAGGTSITITGTGFRTGARVKVGTAAATSVVVNSATSITCATPAGTAGAKSVTVLNEDNKQGTKASPAFTYS